KKREKKYLEFALLFARAISRYVGIDRSRREEIKRQESERRWLASSRWVAAAQFALAVSLTSSQNDLLQLEIDDENNILNRTKDAVITLQSILEGKHDTEIHEKLEQHNVPSIHCMIKIKVCNFGLYRPIRAVHIGPPGYRYADRPLPGGSVKNRPLAVD
ncbi:hypothetical protein BHM03_00062435, partial [Ensete ventricosum]